MVDQLPLNKDFAQDGTKIPKPGESIKSGQTTSTYSVVDTDGAHVDNNKPFLSESIRKSIYNNITPNLYPAAEFARAAGRLITGKKRPYGTDAILPEEAKNMGPIDEDA